MKGKVNFLILLAFLLISNNSLAQVGINADGSSPDTSAMLDVKSGDKGILIPRLDDTAMNNIASPATGLLVYNTTQNDFYYFDGANWVPIGSASNDGDWIVNGNDMYSAVSGNVGIGNNIPEFKLDVNGNIRHGNSLYIYSNRDTGTGYNVWAQFNSPSNGWGDNIVLGAGGTTILGAGESATYIKQNIDMTDGHEILYLASDNKNNDIAIEFITNLQDNDWNTKIQAMTILGNGNIGIETMTPSEKLVIGKNLGDVGSGNWVVIGSDTNYPGLALGYDHNNYGYITYNNTDNYLRFSTKSNGNFHNTFYLKNNKVGIRVSDPIGTLHLAYTNDAGPNGASNPGSDLVIGSINSQHLEIDNNEIHSMSNSNTGATLYLNNNGGKTEFGDLIRIRPGSAPASPQEGDIYMDSNTHKLRCYDGNAWHDLW